MSSLSLADVTVQTFTPFVGHSFDVILEQTGDIVVTLDVLECEAFGRAGEGQPDPFHAANGHTV